MLLKLSHVFVLAVSILLFAVASLGQGTVACPQFEFEGVQGLWMLHGGPNQISIKSLNPAVTPTRYAWTFSRGKIVEGQGTSSISLLVEPSNEYSPVTASVAITGLPEGCSQVFKTDISVSPVGCELAIDHYGKVSKEEEMVRLESFFIRISNDAENEGFFVIGFERNASRTYKINRLKRVLQIVRRRQLDISKLTFGIHDRRENQAEETEYQIGKEYAIPSIDSENYTLIKGERLESELFKLFPRRSK